MKIKDGDSCDVTAGTHAGKSGTVRDINTSKTGAVTITVVQGNGERFKTLAKNVVVGKAPATKKAVAKNAPKKKDKEAKA